MDSGQQVSEGEATIESLENSVFTVPEPVREDQVQNAVNFLSHPKVRGSPVLYRRAFLEKKGLTKDEIDEAFRRLPVRSISSYFSFIESYLYVLFFLNSSKHFMCHIRILH